MKAAARIALIAAAAAVGWPAGARADGTIRQAIGAQALFPLREGNTWTYSRGGPAETSEWTVSVTGKVTAPRVHPYLLLDGYFPGAGRAVRADLFGTVTERSNGFRDHLWYLLGAPEGTRWTLQLAQSQDAVVVADCIGGAKLTLASRGETLSVPAGDFAGVVRVDWAAPCADAGIVSEWFAPGVGLIRRDETSIAGTVTSELVRAELGGVVLPRIGYVTSLALDRPQYTNNLMPPVGPDALPTVGGALTLLSRGEARLTLRFSGCRSASIAVVNEAGEVVLTTRTDDGDCCECERVTEWDLGRGPLVLPFSFRLATADAQPLPDGRYAVWVTLSTLDPEPVRPAARALVEVASVH
jgi:hypothetical protein